ncbi:hypothetical protein CV102_00395 [Natronococcus pandeyae]|uniref:Uncharacterized protein n=1 Tax=Natronococcus pandeyae TaxID=2055836 RepID=A0A8J8TTD2_9EURY|nr:hypothetical protein [Natronococcus pandeyae]TYL40075.1 hypothetical protein CV102_00395 [Natronococcus pandeyae]
MGSGETDETLDSYGTDVNTRDSTLYAIVDWVMLHGNRSLITVALTVGVFLFLLAVHALGFISFVNDDTVTRMVGGMIAGTFSLITLVVSVNQMILSREFQSAGEFRERLGGVIDFRQKIEDTTGVAATPAAPAGQLELLIEEIDYRADRIVDSVADDRNDEARERVERFVSSVKERTGRASETLEQARFGSFDALSSAMGYNDAWQIYAARYLSNQYEEELSEETRDALEDLIESLQLFNTGREHFKTTYLQRELTRLSQLTILLGIPSVLAAFLLGLLYGGIGGPMISISYAPIVASGLMAIVFSPLALLSSYILRTATVARRTASIGPMIPQKDPDEGPFEVSHGKEAEAEAEAD